MQACLWAGAVGVPQVEQREWPWQISSIVPLLHPADSAQVTAVSRAPVPCVCTVRCTGDNQL